VQQRQQRRLGPKRHGLLAQVSSRAEQSYRDMLHTLSDWGVIPRMDVTPLEAFDEVRFCICTCLSCRPQGLCIFVQFLSHRITPCLQFTGPDRLSRPVGAICNVSLPSVVVTRFSTSLLAPWTQFEHVFLPSLFALHQLGVLRCWHRCTLWWSLPAFSPCSSKRRRYQTSWTL
jgi:hypothetical protein